MTDDEPVQKPDGTRWIQVASLIPLLVMVLAWAISPSIREICGQGFNLVRNADLAGIREWAAELGWWAPAVTGSLMIVQAIAAPVPAVMITAANSFLFGPFWGGVYSIFTANVAAAVCYGIGRGYGTLVVDSLISKTAVEKYESFFKSHGSLTVLVARLVPFVPFDPISYVAGLVRMPFWGFFWATMLGQIPAGMAYSYLVQTVDKPSLFLVYAVCFIAVLTLVSLAVRRAWIGADRAEPK